MEKEIEKKIKILYGSISEPVNFAFLMTITQKLMHWYDRNKRELPWRNTRDPYRVWLSEIILQQTRVDQGLDYFNRFIEKFPTVEHLARAGENEVLKAWQGLGYYSRAANLHKTAKMIANDFHGIFPGSYEALLKLKGVGPYTAAAIASISFGKPCPVLDGNVARVIARLFAVAEPVDKNPGKKILTEILEGLIDKSDPGKFNQAVMEFGALWCKPKSPSCEDCPLAVHCLARARGMVDSLPVKAGRVKQRSRYFNYFLLRLKRQDGNFVYLRKRGNADIWRGLFDLPLLETGELLPQEKVLQTARQKGWLRSDGVLANGSAKSYEHQLTHQLISARFFSVEIVNEIDPPDEHLMLVHEDELGRFPLPRLIEKYLQHAGLI